MRPQLHSRQLQKYKLRLVVLVSRRTLSSMQRYNATPKNAAAVMEDGRPPNSATAAWITSSEVVDMMASLKKMRVDYVCNMYQRVEFADLSEVNES